jgi:hypothetical protein
MLKLTRSPATPFLFSSISLTIYRKYPFVGGAVKLAAIEKLKATPQLQYTRFITGTFMDYFGPPTIPTHLRTISLLLDMEHNRAAVPGDGNIPIVLSHSTTIAAFVAASLDLESWPEASFIIGQRLTPNELVSIAESVKGISPHCRNFQG